MDRQSHTQILVESVAQTKALYGDAKKATQEAEWAYGRGLDDSAAFRDALKVETDLLVAYRGAMRRLSDWLLFRTESPGTRGEE